MKKLFALAAVAALVSSPALARSAQHQQTHARAAQAMMQDRQAGGPYAAYAGDPSAVYVDGRYVGSDPDANVRLQMKNDYYTNTYGQ